VLFCLDGLETDMSDFDREAERERLREKYENDQRKRQSTQRMSELLLKGATMTNSHCEECGDPIFRHEGTEFCPTCQHGDDAAEATNEATEAATDAADETPATPDAGGSPDEAEGTEAGDTPTTADGRPTPRTSGEVPSRATDGESRADATAVPSEQARRAPAAEGGRAAARASLERSLARFAQAAEETDDPRRARDRLAAAREAAEALAALDRR
jgi:uncharacterized Zn finger protein (UPF0148 family)